MSYDRKAKCAPHEPYTSNTQTLDKHHIERMPYQTDTHSIISGSNV